MVPNTLMFRAGLPDSTLPCINIIIIDDSMLEEVEIFHVSLHTEDPNVDFNRDFVTIFIKENEGNCIV